MTTRRDIITSGLGLAGIIAAGRAPAALVRSMVAARATAMGGGGGWKNPYVTDGLVAMWDGEWNVAGGFHDSSATVWTDVVNGIALRPIRDGGVESVLSFGDTFANHNNVLKEDGDGFRLLTEEMGGGDITIECACEILHAVMYLGFFALAQNNITHGLGVRENRLTSVVTQNGSQIGRFSGAGILPSAGSKETFSFVSPDKRYMNGAWSPGYSSVNSSSFVANSISVCDTAIRSRVYKTHCIRVYKRCLSDEERGQNLSVDKERFW